MSFCLKRANVHKFPICSKQQDGDTGNIHFRNDGMVIHMIKII